MLILKDAQGFQAGIWDLRCLSIHLDSISDYLVPSFPHAISLMCFSLGYGFFAKSPSVGITT